MKNFVVLLLILQATVCCAQTFNYADHEGHEITFGSVCINAKSYYLISSNKIKYCCSDEVWLVAKDDNGAELWRTHIATEPLMTRCRLAVSSDNTLLVSAGTDMYGCDYKGPRTHVNKADTSGVIWWTQIHYRRFINLNPQPDGTFHLISLDSLFHCNGAGQLVSSLSLGLGNKINAECATLLMNGKVLVNYINTTGPHFRINTSSGANVLDIQTPGNLTYLREAPDSSIIGLAGNHLQRYSKNLGLLKTSATSLPSNFVASVFDLRHDTIFLAGETTSISPAFYLLDTSFNILSQGFSNVEMAKCTGISVSTKNKLTLITYALILPSQVYSFSGVFQTGFNGNLQAKHDIGVKSTSIISSNYHLGGTYAPLEINAAVTVQNFGTDTIYSFHLTDHEVLHSYSYCFLGLNKSYQQKIAPGDSVTVNTGTYETAWLAASAPSTIDYTLCLNTSVPNQTNDIDVSNDALCKSFNFTRVDLKEIPPDQQLKIFPNPASGDIFIESATAVIEIEIYTMGGQLITTFRFLSKPYRFAAGNLDPGIYLVKLKTEKGKVNKRLVVQ